MSCVYSIGVYITYLVSCWWNHTPDSRSKEEEKYGEESKGNVGVCACLVCLLITLQLGSIVSFTSQWRSAAMQQVLFVAFLMLFNVKLTENEKRVSARRKTPICINESRIAEKNWTNPRQSGGWAGGWVFLEQPMHHVVQPLSYPYDVDHRRICGPDVGDSIWSSSDAEDGARCRRDACVTYGSDELCARTRCRTHVGHPR